jgi:hypothetical protein
VADRQLLTCFEIVPCYKAFSYANSDRAERCLGAFMVRALVARDEEFSGITRQMNTALKFGPSNNWVSKFYTFCQNNFVTAGIHLHAH